MITTSSKCLPRKSAGRFRFTDLPYQTYPSAFATEPNGTCDLRIDGVALTAGWRRVVRLVQDQHRARPEIAEPASKRPGVGLIDQQPV
jgi:hypothetical protein